MPEREYWGGGPGSGEVGIVDGVSEQAASRVIAVPSVVKN
jgi:hypothetical protein